MISQFRFCIVVCDILTQNMLRTIFHHFKFLKSDRNVSDCIFWKYSYKRKCSFIFIFCTRNRHSTIIESYIRKNDVIKCELDLTLIEKSIHYLALTNHCREDADKLSRIVVAKKNVDKLSQIAVAKTLYWE